MYFTIASKKNKDTLAPILSLLNENSVSPSVGRAVKYYYSSRQINPTVFPLMYPLGF